MQKSPIVLAALLLSISPVFGHPFAKAAGVGELITCPESSAVYYIAEDAKRHVFPNEHVYHSWYPDFTEVKTIACEDLATYPMGGRIEYQAGIRLIKTQIDPTVYVVEPNGELRQVPDEDTAKALYGDDWAKSVDDIPEVFFVDYHKGEPLTSGEVPEGMVLTDDQGKIFRINADGAAESLDTILDTDQEELFKHHARPLEDIEAHIEKTFDKIEFLTSEIDRLSALLDKLKLVQVEDQNKISVPDVQEIESESGDQLEAVDDINEAQFEIDAAQQSLTTTQSLLDEAKNYLTLAQTALAAGDYKTAKTNAKLAKEKAMAARGKSSELIESRRHGGDASNDDNSQSNSNQSGSGNIDDSIDSSTDDNSVSP